MNGKYCIITGTNSGIGKITAIELAKLNYNLILIMRDSENSKNAYSKILEYKKDNSIEFIPTDLSSFKSIKNTIYIIKNKYSKIDVLINNAGVFKSKRDVNDQNIELTMMVNYFALFYFTNSLIDLINNSKSPRIVNVSSGLHKNGKYHIDEYNKSDDFSAYNTYGDTKLYLVMYSKYLASLYPNFEVFSNHPGVIATNIFRETPKLIQGAFNLILTSVEDGAKSNIMLATSDNLNGKSGLYFDKLKEAKTNPIANDKDLQKELYEKTQKIIEKYIE